MNFLEKLDKLMNERGINKSILSKESGVPYTTIDGMYKKGYKNIKLSTIRKIANYFNTTLDYLVVDEVYETEKNSYNNIKTISNSNIGALGENSSGTVNIHNSQDEDEISKEILRIVKKLPLKERSKLLVLVYEFEENFDKKFLT